MHNYRHILVAADLFPSDDIAVLSRAQEIANASEAKITLIHVVEAFYNYVSPHVIENTSDWEGQTVNAAREKLSNLGKSFDIPTEHQIVTVGTLKEEILIQAKKISADLIIVGSHSKHAFNLHRLTSTADKILHNATCDVLSVFVENKNQIASATEVETTSQCL